MGTQVVRHTSRGVDITLNFASTENNLSWSFTQEGDGEIYDVSSTNVASYTIAGGVVTLPYAVTNGSSYAVSIVKTTTGQTASITFKTRRATVKTAALNVPDFGTMPQGRYNYVIHTDGTVTKRDTSTRQPANYTGAGTWDNSNIVATYTLPAVTNYTWVFGEFVYVGGIPKIIFCSRYTYTATTGACYFHVCVLNLNTGVITNLDETVTNGYTQIPTGSISASTAANSGIVTIYDFISQKLYIGNGYAAPNQPLIVDLIAKTISVLSINHVVQQLLWYNNVVGYNERVYPTNPFNPIDGTIATLGLYNVNNNKKGVLLGYMTPSAVDVESGYYCTSGYGSSGSAFIRFDFSGNRISVKTPTGSAGNQGAWHYSNALKQGICISTITSNIFGIYDKTSDVFIGETLANIEVSDVLRLTATSDYSGVYMLATYRVTTYPTMPTKTRIHYAKHGQSPLNYGYEDILAYYHFLTDKLNY